MLQLVSTKANEREPGRYEWLVLNIGLGCLVVLHVLHAVFLFALKPRLSICPKKLEMLQLVSTKANERDMDGLHKHWVRLSSCAACIACCVSFCAQTSTEYLSEKTCNASISQHKG
jgi:hypothetical protein